MYHFESKEALTEWIINNVVGTAEATEILNCSRQNLHKFVISGKLVPIKEAGRERLFFRDDLFKRKEEASLYHQKK